MVILLLDFAWTTLNTVYTYLHLICSGHLALGVLGVNCTLPSPAEVLCSCFSVLQASAYSLT